MSKEEFLKIQTCVLKVHIDCDGCKQKVKKLLQKIDGVYKITVDAEQGKVTVSGNIEPSTLIKRLAKSGKHAEIWGAQKAPTSNQNQLNNQIKTMQIESNKGGKDSKPQKGGKEQPKGGQQQIQPQQLQQMKGFGDLKLPQLKDLKNMMPFGKEKKTVKFDLPEEDEFSDGDDDFDDFDNDDFSDDDEFDDNDLGKPLTKAKPSVGKGATGMMNFINAKSGGVEIPVQVKGTAGNNGNSGKNGGGGGGGNKNQGGGAPKKDGKGGGAGAGVPQDGKNAGGGNKGVGGGGNNHHPTNGGKNGGKNDGVQVMNSMMHQGFSGMDVTHGLGGGNAGQMGNIPMTHMGNFPMGNIPAVQGLPAAGGSAYYTPAPPDYMAPNPYQQQYMPPMMHQPPPSGMYAAPFAPVPYMPPPEPYPNYVNHDENTDSSCTIM